MNEKTNNIEIDLGQFLKSIIKGIKGLLKLLIKVFLFYKERWILFSILFIVAAIGGYFLEETFNLNKRYKQEIILAPKYDTTSYMYQFIENLNLRLKDEDFLKELNLELSNVKELEAIILKPIIQSEDVLNELQGYNEGQNFLNKFMVAFEEEALNSKKYSSFFKHHKLTLIFSGKNEDNIKVSKQILAFINDNKYYNDELSLGLRQTKSNLEKNKETLVFIEEYLNTLSKNPFNQKKNIIVVGGGESEIPTITSLLDKKESVIGMINFQERILKLNTKLFSILEFSNITPYPVEIYRRLFLLLPTLMFIVTSIMFLFKNTIGKLKNFVNS